MRISDWSSDVCSSDLVAELPQQLRLAPLGPLDVAVLDVAEAADLLRHARQLDGDAVALRGQPRDDLLDRREVLVAQPPLHLPLVAAPEHVEAAAAQPLYRRQRAERRPHPRPEGQLLLLPGLRAERREARDRTSA